MAAALRNLNLNGVKAAESFNTILADDRVDVVSIASYDDAHFWHVREAITAGKHVFVEKPLCRSIEELLVIERAWRESGKRHIASNLILRTAPAYQWLKRMIEGGELGEIYAVDGDYLYGRIDKITEGWRNNVRDYSVMQGGGIHLVDLMLWITGSKPISVSCFGNQICTKGTSFRYSDYMAATFQFPTSIVGRITANFGCMHRHQHVMRVFGTRGTFICDDLGARFHTSRDASVSPKTLSLSAAPASKRELIPTFIEAVLKGEDSSTQAQHEFDVISVCVAADHAMLTKTVAKVRYMQS
jgi:predicted dehydrogenase